jgi:hypothetical protein
MVILYVYMKSNQPQIISKVNEIFNIYVNFYVHMLKILIFMWNLKIYKAIWYHTDITMLTARKSSEIGYSVRHSFDWKNLKNIIIKSNRYMNVVNHRNNLESKW